MITIQSAMLVALGVFLAGLAVFLLLPFYGRRAARLATDELRRAMPLSEAEIRADKDRLRAEHAVAIHKLEMKVDEAAQAAARQLVEINRRDAGISTLEGELAQMRTLIEENENARRVLEQTITDRLPRVEQRLTDAKKLLYQRDREISTLTNTASKQAHALEEATQINTQQRDEIHRLNATIATRAARKREHIGRDQRFDEEVALRAELEALRTKSRDQASLIGRLQGAQAKSGRAFPSLTGTAANKGGGGPISDEETARLRQELVDAESALKSVRDAAVAGKADHAAIQAEARKYKTENVDLKSEITKLKASLKAYEAEDTDVAAVKESKIAMKARLSALEAQARQNADTIQSLRAEVAAANEKLAKQAAHYVEEMRRLGSGTIPATGPKRHAASNDRKKTLAERIAAPRKEAVRSGNGSKPQEKPAHRANASTNQSSSAQDPLRVSGFLRALDKDAAQSATAAEDATAETGQKDSKVKKSGRRPGLIERLTGADKPAASG